MSVAPARRAGADGHLELGLSDDSYREAMERAGRMLARRPMARAEVANKLRQAGHDEDVVDRVVARLEELRLVDDAEFARTWARHRGERGRGASAITDELIAKGVDREVAEAAVEELSDAELERAVDVAVRQFRRIASKPPREHGPRLIEALLRRGFEREVAEAAAAKVLPPEGWD